MIKIKHILKSILRPELLLQKMKEGAKINIRNDGGVNTPVLLYAAVARLCPRSQTVRLEKVWRFPYLCCRSGRHVATPLVSICPNGGKTVTGL